jgi:hypothetical protein
MDQALLGACYGSKLWRFFLKVQGCSSKKQIRAGLGKSSAKRGDGRASSRALQGATNKLRAPQACLAGKAKVVIGDKCREGQ